MHRRLRTLAQVPGRCGCGQKRGGLREGPTRKKSFDSRGQEPPHRGGSCRENNKQQVLSRSLSPRAENARRPADLANSYNRDEGHEPVRKSKRERRAYEKKTLRRMKKKLRPAALKWSHSFDLNGSSPLIPRTSGIWRSAGREIARSSPPAPKQPPSKGKGKKG